MKKLLGFALMCALFSTPLFAANLFASKGTTVNIPDTVTVGSTQIAAGEYKLSYEGTGPAVKVTLVKHGSSPVVLDAKFVEGKNNGPSVTTATVNGVRTLQQIDIKGATLVF
jgi:hypothetical protein